MEDLTKEHRWKRLMQRMDRLIPKLLERGEFSAELRKELERNHEKVSAELVRLKKETAS